MQDGLGASKNKAHVGFAVVCVSSPTLGVVATGPLSRIFIGDDQRKVIPFCLVVAFLATACAAP